MRYAYQVAGKKAKKRATANKRIYDTGVKENRLEVGDAVHVQNVGLKGWNKLADRWERDPYVIVDIPDLEVSVFQIRLESGKGPLRMVHRNFILPFISVPSNEEDPTPITPRVRRRHRTRAAVRDESSYGSGSSSSDDSVSRYVITQRRNPDVRRSRAGTRLQSAPMLDASSTPLESLQASSPTVQSTAQLPSSHDYATLPEADTAIQHDAS